MTNVEYYKNYFLTDVQNIMKTLNDNNKLSIHHFVRPGTEGRTKQAYLKSKSQRMFLHCFFFLVLIDQAIHAGLREEHAIFERIAGYPKFVGILSSYNSNMHPTLLLLIGTSLQDGENEYSIIKCFEELTEYFLDDYENFFHCVFPQYADSLETKSAQTAVYKTVLLEMQNAMLWKNLQKDFNFITPNIQMFRLIIKFFNETVNRKLTNLKMN